VRLGHVLMSHGVAPVRKALALSTVTRLAAKREDAVTTSKVLTSRHHAAGMAAAGSGLRPPRQATRPLEWQQVMPLVVPACGPSSAV